MDPPLVQDREDFLHIHLPFHASTLHHRMRYVQVNINTPMSCRAESRHLSFFHLLPTSRDLIRSLPFAQPPAIPVYVPASPAAPFSTSPSASLGMTTSN